MSDPIDAIADDRQPVPSDTSLSGSELEKSMQFRELAPAVEFSCWVVVVLAPFLRWVNGAAVTDDQFVIQVTLFTVALAGAIGLRIYNWRTGRQDKANSPLDQSHRE
jgi:hypothetical protein